MAVQNYAGYYGYGATPQANTVSASTTSTPNFSPAYIDPNQNQEYLQQYEQEFEQGVAPTFALQQSQLQDSNAARGISNSGAASYLQGNLLGQQAAATAAGIDPILQQAYGNTQQDILTNYGTYNNQNAELLSAYLGSYAPASGVGSLYGSEIGGQNQAYESTVNAQNQALEEIGSAAGAYFTGGASLAGSGFASDPGDFDAGTASFGGY
jgi:hypothetical protein